MEFYFKLLQVFIFVVDNNDSIMTDLCCQSKLFSSK